MININVVKKIILFVICFLASWLILRGTVLLMFFWEYFIIPLGAFFGLNFIDEMIIVFKERKNRKPPHYVFHSAIVWFFSPLSIWFGFRAAFADVPAACGIGGPEFMGFATLAFGTIAILSFLIALPAMIFFRRQHRILTKSANAKSFILLLINISVLVFMFVIANNARFFCPFL